MTTSVRLPKAAAVAGYGLIWALSTAYLAYKGADWTFPVFSLAIFGLALTGLAWVLTRGVKAPEISVNRPGLETGAILGYLVLYAFIFLGPVLSTIKASFPPGQVHDLVILGTKLIVHVALPMLLLVLIGARVRPLLDPGLKGRNFWRTLVVLGIIFFGLNAVVSPSLKNIADTHASVATLLWAAPATFIWMTLEAGLCEEFLFRAVLQTRLSKLFGSALVGILVTSVVFALAHVPGLYLRGDAETFGASKDVFQVMAYTVAGLSPIAVLFGTLWARTRSFLLIVLLHGAIDTLPDIAEFLHTWAL